MAYTSAQLAQYALNLAVAEQNQIIEGQADPATKGGVTQTLAAVIMLAEAVIAINSSNTGGPATLPASLLTGKWSATQPSTSPINV